MPRRIILSLIALFMILSFAYAMWGPPQKERIKGGYKTHVSKYGFSVSYPGDWYLEEIWRSTDIPENKKGWLDFIVANKDPHYYIPLGGDSIEIHFTGFVDDLKGSPSEIGNKLKYYADKHGTRSIEKKEIINMGDKIFYLAYGVPRGHSYKFHVLMFYLPKTNKIATAIIRNTGAYDVRGLLKVVIIKIYDSD